MHYYAILDIHWESTNRLFDCMFVWSHLSHWRFFSLIWRRHHYRWKAANFDTLTHCAHALASTNRTYLAFHNEYSTDHVKISRWSLWPSNNPVFECSLPSLVKRILQLVTYELITLQIIPSKNIDYEFILYSEIKI